MIPRLRAARPFFLLLTSLSLPTKAISEVKNESVKAVADSPMTLIKRTIVEITSVCEKTGKGAHGVDTHKGTGFIISVHEGMSGVQWFYLVTSRHVVEPGIENGNPCKVLNRQVRLNLKKADDTGTYSKLITAPLPAGWFYPEDDSVDLAVAPMPLDFSSEDISLIPISRALTATDFQTNEITEGDAVFFAGLFVQFTGETRVEPIVRTGKIAMVPKEKMPTTLGKQGDVYLVDVHVFGGNSGSPLLIDVENLRPGMLSTGHDYRLLGVISGYMKETADFELRSVASYAGTADANSGIAIVVPAQQLVDLVESGKMQAWRALHSNLRPQAHDRSK